MIKMFNWRVRVVILGSMAGISINFTVSNPLPIPQS